MCSLPQPIEDFTRQFRIELHALRKKVLKKRRQGNHREKND